MSRLYPERPTSPPEPARERSDDGDARYDLMREEEDRDLPLTPEQQASLARQEREWLARKAMRYALRLQQVSEQVRNEVAE